MEILKLIEVCFLVFFDLLTLFLWLKCRSLYKVAKKSFDKKDYETVINVWEKGDNK